MNQVHYMAVYLLRVAKYFDYVSIYSIFGRPPMLGARMWLVLRPSPSAFPPNNMVLLSNVGPESSKGTKIFVTMRH